MEYERVREQIAEFLFNADHRNQAFGLKWEFSDQEYYRKEADKILSLDGIEIRADDQSLPQADGWGEVEHWEGYDLCAELMSKAGFIRVIPKRK